MTGTTQRQPPLSGAPQTRHTSREQIVAPTCPFARRLQAIRLLTDSAPAQMRITIPSERTNTAAPQTRPLVSISTDQRLRLTINFVD